MEKDIYLERFENLIRVLEAIQAHSQEQSGQLKSIFNLESWYHEEGAQCETSACAIGWCCFDPWFKSQGLTLKAEQVTGNYPIFVPEYEGFGGWDAAGRFFGVSLYEANYLFREDSYSGEHPVTAEDVIERVKAFIEKALNEE